MTQIYHITHVQNLQSIIEHGGLWCDSGRDELGLGPVNIAHSHIKARRAQKAVLMGAGGTLADYVPFYFAPRSPMLYPIHTGRVAGYNGGQRPIVHLVTSVENVVERDIEFLFTDGHAVIAYSRFFGDLIDLQNVDWAIMQSKFWMDTPQDTDRKRRRLAEFLAHTFAPWELFTEIGVHNETIASQVNGILASTEYRPIVTVRHDWYY